MTKYHEILRLKSLNFSDRNIALSCSCSRNTVSKVLKRASELDISWPVEDCMTDLVNRLKLIGLVIQHISLILIPVKLSAHLSSSVS